MNSLKLAAAAAAALGLTAVAATMPAPGRISTSGRSTLIGTPRGTVAVTPMGPDIFRVSRIPAGERTFSYPPSQSSVLESSTESVSWSADPAAVTFITPSTTLRVDRVTGRVTFLDAAGDTLLNEAEGVVNQEGARRISFANGRAQNFYGAGERAHRLRLNGDTLVMFNRQNYGYGAGDPRISQMGITMPWFASDNGYGVLVDDYARARLFLGADSIVYTSETRKPLSYFFVNGGDLENVTANYTLLTGRQSLPPFWALGYITSRYGYHNEQEALGAIDSLRREGYPVDGIVFDLYWYGKEEDMGRLAWDQQQWPDHKKMLADLKERGVNTVIISQPYILRNGRGLENYNELALKGLLVKDSTGGPQEVKIWVGEGGMFDVSNPDTRSWLRERYKALTLEGVGGWWGDLGEPEVHPETGIHANGLSAREYHNLYGNDWSSVISDLFASEFPDRRLMTMMRGGTTGLQRYSVYPWSTDVSRSWGGLQPQITIMLNSGLSGLGYMSHDVGGFAIDPDAPYDPELYVRWLQLGTFSPILRTHAQATAEPYNYPDQQHIILPLIKERYRWLPYNYTLAYENASQGLPLVRPLNFYSSGSDRFDDITDEYLWGRDILVAPVMTQGATRRSIVFPDGLWVDYNNPGRLYNGGDTVTYPAPLEVLPLFVRAGAIIPQADYGMQSTEDYRTDRYTINYYPYLGKSEYTLFEDDRKSPGSLDEGAYSLINFTGEASIEGINLDISSQGTYPGAPKVKDLTFRIHLVDGDPSSVSVDGHKLKRGAWKFDRSESMLTFKIKWNVDKPLAIHIR